MIRSATLDDLEALVALEERCFDSDRLSRRNFRYLIGRGNAALLIDLEADALRGYALVLFRTGTSLARLYSIAVAPEYRGRGVAQALLEHSEAVSRERDCIAMRLEIRVDNAAGEQLYRKMGYRPFGTYPDYYEDHADALRMEKSLVAHLKPATTRVPYYEQTLDFTCGPATMIMAMQALDPTLAP
ncbi:MAG TPA: peptidase C39 family protein, partial [Gammaproteobacteria bacterium]|nr:peptidase C39 family protein [Gammaproteobacteria bacterium]